MSSPGLPASLRDAIASGTLVPFVGAGVSMAVRRKTGEPAFPSWRGLLLRAADRMDAEMRDGGSVVRAMLDMQQPRYLDAARYARTGLGNLWADFLRDTFNVRRKEIDSSSLELARRVWALNSRLVITTNYDRVLRWTCPDRDDLEEIEIEAPTQLLAATRGKLERSTIWHLHGSLSEPANIILSPDGYELLYANERQSLAYRAALTTLRNMIASRTLLFVGFSLDDPYLVRQLEWVRDEFSGFAGPHYILVRGQDAGPVRAKFIELGVDIVTFEDFGAPLHQRLDELKVAPKEGPALASAPTSSAPQSPTTRTTVPQPAVPEPVKPLASPLPSARPKGRMLKLVLASAAFGILLASIAILATENGLWARSHQECNSFQTQGYFLQLASYHNAEHAVSQAAKLEQEASRYKIPGESVLLVRPPFVVVGLTGFSDYETASEYMDDAKSILGQGGYMRSWEDFCDEIWSSEDPSAKASITDLEFNALRSRRHCFCFKQDQRQQVRE